MFFILSIQTGQHSPGVFFQTNTPVPLFQNHTVVIAAAVVLALMLIRVWGLYKRSLNRLKAMEKSLQQKARDLQQSEVRYRQLVEQITAVTYVVNDDFHSSNIFISPQITKICGIHPKNGTQIPVFGLTSSTRLIATG